MNSKPKLIIVHGWGGSRQTWSDFVSLAESDFEVEVIELPCFGAEPCPSSIWGVEEYAKFISDKIKLINQSTNKPVNSMSFVESGLEIFVELAGVVDFAKEKEKLGSEIEQLTKYIAGLEGKLNNPGFVSSAPENIVTQEKEKLAESKEKLEKLNKQFQAI